MNQPPLATAPPEPGAAVYAGLFGVTMATLLLELGLTRLFSVIIYYHMAFFAVSVTLFGLALGGVAVHFFPRLFTPQRAAFWMGVFSILFAATTVAALLLLLAINFDVTRNAVLVPQLLLVSVALAVPFTCSGTVVALALTRFPGRTNRLYGIDLAGASLGCLLYAPLMTALGAPRFVAVVSLISAGAGLVLLWSRRREPGARAGAFAAVAVALVIGGVLEQSGPRSRLRIRYARSFDLSGQQLDFEGWNSISRVIAYPEPEPLPGSGVAPAFHEETRAPQRMMLIDMFAATPILEFDGRSFDRMAYAFRDLSYAVHAVRPGARVAVIGVGGGRDILAAKAWGQPEIIGIEINSRVIEALTDRFADYAGRPTAWPGVTIVRDEARSFITGSAEPFDIIQASLIDTFAATSAGAFVLSENALYTLEGWSVFLDHLTETGILTMSRWYNPQYPVESVRLLALARAALEARGAQRPQAHLLMARGEAVPGAPPPLGTLLVKKTPFTAEEIERFETWIAENQHVLLVTPRAIHDDALRGVIESPSLADYAAAHRYDISPPTDDRPFFFNVLRWRDILDEEFRRGSDYIYSINFKPIVILGTLLITVVVMALLFVVVPSWIEQRLPGRERLTLPAATRLGRLVFFMMLGLGYLTIELALMQRLTVFLGHPSYSLTVCLFTMLLASGLGSMAAPRLFGGGEGSGGAPALGRLGVLIAAVLIVTLAVALAMMQAMAAQSTPVRIVLAAALLAPAAFLMGMPFPLALQAAARDRAAPLSWYWAVNGAMSVCATVLTVVLAHSIGLRATFLIGVGCYLVAALASRAFRPAPH